MHALNKQLFTATGKQDKGQKIAKDSQKTPLISVHCVGHHNKRLGIQAEMVQHTSSNSAVTEGIVRNVKL